MSFSDAGSWIAICALCLALAAGIARSSGFYRARLVQPGGRFDTVDGLRGFLALAVFGEHAASMQGLMTTGVWGEGVAPFYTSASKAGVSLFFMITAFLFWLRVLRSGASFDTRGFFLSRLRRLTPMYAFSVLMALAVVAAASGFSLRVEPAALLRELRPWLSFGFMTTGELNGVRDAHAINAVYWTLAYEWLFYLALPLAALFARGAWVLVPVAVLLVFGGVAPIVFSFLFGAAAATLVHRRVLQERAFSRPWLAPLPLLALVAWFFAAGLHSLLQLGLLFVFFVSVVHGYSVLGLLHTRAAKLLGMTSYSIYLIHCIVLYVVTHAVDRVAPVAGMSPLQYWLVAACAASVTVALSSLTYRQVELPFINPPTAPQGDRSKSWIQRPISG